MNFVIPAPPKPGRSVWAVTLEVNHVPWSVPPAHSHDHQRARQQRDRPGYLHRGQQPHQQPRPPPAGGRRQGRLADGPRGRVLRLGQRGIHPYGLRQRAAHQPGGAAHRRGRDADAGARQLQPADGRRAPGHLPHGAGPPGPALRRPGKPGTDRRPLGGEAHRCGVHHRPRRLRRADHRAPGHRRPGGAREDLRGSQRAPRRERTYAAARLHHADQGGGGRRHGPRPRGDRPAGSGRRSRVISYTLR